MAPGIIASGFANQASSLGVVPGEVGLHETGLMRKPSTLPAGLPTILNRDGPCRTGSDSFVKWQVAHCCLNSVAPSVGLAGAAASARRRSARPATRRVGAGARIDGTWRSSGQIIIFLNDIPARATPQSHVGMTCGNEHQYLQGDGSASSPARNVGSCIWCYRRRLECRPSLESTSNELSHALSGQCRLLAALLGRSCSS
jgi:hypothetical protein